MTSKQQSFATSSSSYYYYYYYYHSSINVIWYKQSNRMFIPTIIHTNIKGGRCITTPRNWTMFECQTLTMNSTSCKKSFSIAIPLDKEGKIVFIAMAFLSRCLYEILNDWFFSVWRLCSKLIFKGFISQSPLCNNGKVSVVSLWSLIISPPIFQQLCRF